MVKVRGYRIELGEIEAALLDHAEVNEAAAVAVPDEEAGNKLRGFVALHPGSTLTPADLQAHCALKIPKYMIPETFELRESLPKTSTGKIDRQTLAKQAIEAATTAVS
jgi:acyl-coenzyme A synthetase/AMP-(fatty) acid ligase